LKRPLLGKFFWLLSILLFLNACTGVSIKDTGPANRQAYQQRVGKLNAIQEWGLLAKISLDDGDQGGSGKLQWRVEPGGSELDFHGALGRGAWHLQIEPGHAVLTEANGDIQSASSVNALLQDRMGWPIPVEALQWWVRGLAAPGEVEDQQIDSEGVLISMRQFGWNVEYSRYDNSAVVAMPKRLNATMNDYRVKLAVSRWNLAVQHVTEH
jgi:outer membrane lipoprotein LolB